MRLDDSEVGCVRTRAGRGVKTVKKAAAVIVVLACILSACGDTSKKNAPATPPVTTAATTTTAAAEIRQYATAKELARDLTSRGIDCIATADTTRDVRVRVAGPHDAAVCTLPVAGDPEGVPITLSVWPTTTAKTTGYASWARFLRSARGSGPQVYYALSGANWVIDFGTQRKAPEQVMEVFGGKLEIID